MNKSGLSQSRNLPLMTEFMASHKRRTHTLQTEVSKLYDKSKNSYSRKFQMKMQLMNQPKKPQQAVAVAKTKVSSMHNTHHRMDSLDGKEKYRGAGGTITHHTSLNRSLEIPRRNLQDDEEISNLNGSGFIRIEGEGDYLEGVETRQALIQEYRQVIRQIEKVKQNCQDQQTKLRNADQSLKTQKRLLLQQRKQLKSMDRLPSQLTQLQLSLRKQKQQVLLLLHTHQRAMLDLRQALQHVQQYKQTQLDKLQYIAKIKKEQEQKQQRKRLQAAELDKLKSEEQGLLLEKQQLERENYEQMEQLSKVKGISAPPYDLHRKYLERLERLQMMTDLEKVEAYIQVKDSAKNDKKVLQRMKEELAKKKEENNDLKKKLEEKRKYSDKYEKLMREKATAMLELNQKLLNYDLKPR